MTTAQKQRKRMTRTTQINRHHGPNIISRCHRQSHFHHRQRHWQRLPHCHHPRWRRHYHQQPPPLPPPTHHQPHHLNNHSIHMWSTPWTCLIHMKRMRLQAECQQAQHIRSQANKQQAKWQHHQTLSPVNVSLSIEFIESIRFHPFCLLSAKSWSHVTYISDRISHK